MVYVLSRKTKIAIARNLKSLIDRTFTEPTVKELLVDLREISKKILEPKEGTVRNEKMDQIFKDFVDICNCIAHPNRDISGVLEKNIRSHVDKMATALRNNEEKIGLSEFSSVDKVISGDAIVCAMLASIFLYISKYDSTFNRDHLNSVFEDKEDISLCIISLLQDTTIRLKDHGTAILHVMDYEGQYRLYCKVLRSTVDRDAKERTGGEGHIIVGFPVMLTNAKNIDNLKFYDHNGEVFINKDLSFLRDSEKISPLIETYRSDIDGKLHVKFIDQ